MFEGALGFEEAERGKRLSLSFSLALTFQLLLLAFLLLHSVLASPRLAPPILNLEMSFLEPPVIKPPAADGGGRKVKLVKRSELNKPKTKKEPDKGLKVPADIPTTIVEKDSHAPSVSIGEDGELNSGSGYGNGVDGGEPGGENGFPASKRKILPPWKVSPPRLLKKVDPAYPAAASAMGITGWVVLQIVVDENGSVESAKVLKSSNVIFEKPSLDAVRKWVYSKPTGSDGQRVACYFMVKLRFEF